jgi:hypothetical protein
MWSMLIIETLVVMNAAKLRNTRKDFFANFPIFNNGFFYLWQLNLRICQP